jgi:hypothetical protein
MLVPFDLVGIVDVVHLVVLDRLHVLLSTTVARARVVEGPGIHGLGSRRRIRYVVGAIVDVILPIRTHDHRWLRIIGPETRWLARLQ